MTIIIVTVVIGVKGFFGPQIGLGSRFAHERSPAHIDRCPNNV
jgi:hypothetical protein